MIAHLNGRLVEKSPTHVVIDCNGIGYQVNISLNTYSHLGDEESCKLYTSFVVREDAQLLYWFYTQAEKKLFQLLISVSGRTKLLRYFSSQQLINASNMPMDVLVYA